MLIMYVDDIICIIRHSDQEMILNEINLQYDNIKLFGLIRFRKWTTNYIVLFLVKKESILRLSEIFQTALSSVCFFKKRNKDYFKTQHFRSCHSKSSPASLSFKKMKCFENCNIPVFLHFMTLSQDKLIKYADAFLRVTWFFK